MVKLRNNNSDDGGDDDGGGGGDNMSQYHYGNKIKENEMGRLCSKHEENEQSIKRFRQSN